MPDLLTSVLIQAIFLVISLVVIYLIIGRVLEKARRKAMGPLKTSVTERLRLKFGILSSFTQGYFVNVIMNPPKRKKVGRRFYKETIKAFLPHFKSLKSDFGSMQSAYSSVLEFEFQTTIEQTILELEKLIADCELELLLPIPFLSSKANLKMAEENGLRLLELAAQGARQLGHEPVAIVTEAWIETYKKFHGVKTKKHRA